jgi:hypothetical protein
MSKDFTVKFLVPNPAFPADEEAPEDLEYSADISVTSWGSPSNYWDDPGEGPEWDIDKMFDPEENEIPYRVDSAENPEWLRLQPFLEKYMENEFDWSDAQDAAAEDYYIYRNET